ncbi:SpoIIE family protein phosphatase [Streptomyces sp. GC420]|nr:SpoIIE family protein phosphatase [Streptomyces sp. GC420]
MLVVAADGAVRRANAAARAVFPRARTGARFEEVVPDWLSSAHHRRHDPARPGLAGPEAPVHGWVRQRFFEAHRSHAGNGDVVWWLTDDTAHRAAQEALHRERERTEFLAEASSLLLVSLNLERCMAVTARLAARYLADAAMVVAPPAGRRTVITSCVRGGEPTRITSTTEAPETVPGLAEALRGFPPVPSRWIDPAAAPDWLLPAGFGHLGSVVVTPLPGHGVPAGALILMRRTDRAAFDDHEEVFARLFAARAGAAMSAARLYAEQASITDTLMRELLPPSLHHVNGVEFAGGYRPAGSSERVGGDFYDLHPAATAEEESLVTLGDVCGKGLEAAVMTGKIRNTLQALLPLAGDHQRVLSLLNGALFASSHTRFATLALASARRIGDSVRVRLTSAGHPAPLVVRADGSVEAAVTRGTLVGVLPEVHSTSCTVTLAPGETCVLYTDGITEARGGPLGDGMFGEERLERALRDCAGMPAEAVVEHVLMLADQWIGAGGHDDMAVVAITAPRGANHGPESGRGGEEATP